MALSDWYEALIEQVNEASIQPPTTKAGLITWYQEHFTGRGAAGWKQHIVKDLALITGQKIKTLEKRFDSGSKGGKEPRINKPEPRNAAQYQALGAKIGTRAPRYGYHIEFDGWVRFSGCEKRNFSVDITGKLAAEVAKENALILNAMLLVYMEEYHEEEEDEEEEEEDESASVSICVKNEEEGVENPEITVSANERERVQGHSGRERRFSFFDRK